MKKFRKCLVGIFCLIAVFQCNILHAEVGPIAVGAYSDESKVTVIVKGIDNSAGTVVGKVSGLDLEECSCQTMEESKEPIKTLILVDGSKSISDEVRSQFYELLFTLFEAASENEEFCLGTFGKEIKYVTEYTSDRFELIKGYKEIESVKQTCYLTDILSEAVDDLNQMEFHGFQRIIVFSDGFNSAKTGVTMEGLYAKLGKKPFPIFTIGVSYRNNKKAIKSLLTISEITGGKGILLKKGKEIGEQEKEYLDLKEYYVLKAKVPEQFQDGSYRPVRFEMEGSKKKQIVEQEVLMYLNKNGWNNNNNVASATPEATEQNELLVEKKTENPMGKKYVILAASITVILFAIAIVLNLVRIKRKKNAKQDVHVKETLSIIQKQPQKVTRTFKKEDAKAGETTVLTSGSIYDAYQETTVLSDGMESSWRIILKDSLNGKIFDRTITERIIIGRISNGENCVIIDYDNSVSKNHCSIIKERDSFYLVDNGSANGTYLNGRRILSAELLNDGDSIDIGKVNLYVAIESV